MAPAKKTSRRKAFYLRHIEACMEQARLGPRQRERAMDPGWSKVRLYARHLDRSNFEAWTDFALGHPAEVVAQAAEIGRPRVPRDQRVRTLVLRLPVGVRDQLIGALRERGLAVRAGQAGGVPRRARDGDEGPIRERLADAGRRRRKARAT